MLCGAVRLDEPRRGAFDLRCADAGEKLERHVVEPRRGGQGVAADAARHDETAGADVELDATD